MDGWTDLSRYLMLHALPFLFRAFSRVLMRCLFAPRTYELYALRLAGLKGSGMFGVGKEDKYSVGRYGRVFPFLALGWVGSFGVFRSFDIILPIGWRVDWHAGLGCGRLGRNLWILREKGASDDEVGLAVCQACCRVVQG